MINESTLYSIVYIPLLASIASNFFNKILNKVFVYFILVFMFLLSVSVIQFGSFSLSYQDKKYLFDNNIYSNSVNLIILAIFLAIKIFFRIKNYNSKKDIDYPLYYICIFSFTIACINANLCNSITFFIIYLLSEYQINKTA